MRIWKLRRNGALLFLAVGAMLIASSCAEKPRTAVGKLDTPDHHTLRGNDSIDEGKWDQAAREFDLALSLDKEFAPALAGKAVVTAHQASEPGLTGERREALTESAQKLVKNALSDAKNSGEEATAHTAGIRVYRLTKTPSDDWVDEAEDHYDDAVDEDERNLNPDPHFFMARVYRDAFALQKASDLYRKVLGMNRGRTKQADDELAILQKVQRAEPGSRHGKVIAFDESITKADIAALFISELKLTALFTRGDRQRFDTGFKAPSKRTFKADSLQRVPDATDIKDHPLRTDIEEVLRLRIVGLEPDPAHLFHPNAKTTRAEFAMMVEDILVNVTGEKGLKTKFIGSNSPFPDVRNSVPYYNAVQTVVSRSLMEPKNKIRGVFGPMDPVSGADALLVIRQLKSELQSYLRSS